MMPKEPMDQMQNSSKALIIHHHILQLMQSLFYSKQLNGM